ncbi:MAG: M48 family metallopeptidase [Longimicrobiales bacterium]
MTDPESISQQVLDLGTGKSLPFELRRSQRRTLGISVHPDGSVVVTAPHDAEMGRIAGVVHGKRSWIRRQLREVAELPPPPIAREWVSGETHRYLGRQYRLKVSDGEQRRVRLIGRFFRVDVPGGANAEVVRRLMERWYLDHAKSTFQRRMDRLVETVPALRLTSSPPLIIRKLTHRWGSCSAEGRILMNVDGVRLSVALIDYLLVHELCHLREPHHGRRFWRLLDRCMPGWERWRDQLDQAEV